MSPASPAPVLVSLQFCQSFQGLISWAGDSWSGLGYTAPVPTIWQFLRRYLKVLKIQIKGRSARWGGTPAHLDPVLRGKMTGGACKCGKLASDSNPHSRRNGEHGQESCAELSWQPLMVHCALSSTQWLLGQVCWEGHFCTQPWLSWLQLTGAGRVVMGRWYFTPSFSQSQEKMMMTDRSIEHFYGRHVATCFQITLNTESQLERWGLVSAQFYRQRNWGTEGESNLPKAIQRAKSLVLTHPTGEI